MFFLSIMQHRFHEKRALITSYTLEIFLPLDECNLHSEDFLRAVLSIISYDYFHNPQLLRGAYRTPSRMIVVFALPACQKPGIETGTISVSSRFYAISKYDGNLYI